MRRPHPRRHVLHRQHVEQAKTALLSRVEQNSRRPAPPRQLQHHVSIDLIGGDIRVGRENPLAFAGRLDQRCLSNHAVRMRVRVSRAYARSKSQLEKADPQPRRRDGEPPNGRRAFAVDVAQRHTHGTRTRHFAHNRPELGLTDRAERALSRILGIDDLRTSGHRRPRIRDIRHAHQ